MSKPITNKKQYEVALEKVFDLMQKNIIDDSKETFELEELSILIEKYEDGNYEIDLPEQR